MVAPARSTDWTGAEIATLRRLYPTGGAKCVARELPRRSISAIYGAAHDLGIYRQGVHRGRKAAAR